MVLMARPESASHACRLKLVRLKGSPEAKLRNRTAAMRLSLSAWSRVGFAGGVDDAAFKEAGRGGIARDDSRREPGAAHRVHRFWPRSPPPARQWCLRRGASLKRRA